MSTRSDNNQLICPHCSHKHELLTDEEVFALNGKSSCAKCGVRFRVEIIEDRCYACNQCLEDNIGRLKTEPLCGKYRPHDSQPTLCSYLEKCSTCNMIFDTRSAPVTA